MTYDVFVLFVLVHVKEPESEKGQSPHQHKLLSPTEHTAPERLVSSPVACDITMSHICITYVCINSRREANQRLKTRQS